MVRILCFCLLLAGCRDILGIDDQVGVVDGGGHGKSDGSGNDPTGISGPIASDQTWSNNVHIVGPTTILPGVRVVVTAGADIAFEPSASLTIKGAFETHGTLLQPVFLEPAAHGGFFGGVSVEGTLSLSYTIQFGGAIALSPGSVSTILDSLMYRAAGDFLVISGGKLTMMYSQIGAPPGELDTTHCNMHIAGNGATLDLEHNVFAGSPYNLMLYGGTGSIMTSNNWLCGGSGCPSHIDIDTQPGISANVSNGFFERGTPTIGAGASVTMLNLATIPLFDAGVRQTP